MLHIGSNARAEAMHQFESLGIDLVSITPQGGQGGFGEDFVERLSTSDVGLTAISPIIQAGTSIRAGNANLTAGLVATREGIFKLAKANVAEGRLISDLDNASAYVVLGSDIAAKLWNAIGRAPEIGSQLAVDGQILTIVGILAPSVPNLVLNLDLNQAIVIPLAAARRLIPEPLVSSIAAQLKPMRTELAMTSAVLETARGNRLPADAIHIQTARQLIAGLDQQMRVYGLLLLGIGAVSLIVGGVGVMNVMLMGVMERKREMGVPPCDWSAPKGHRYHVHHGGARSVGEWRCGRRRNRHPSGLDFRKDVGMAVRTSACSCPAGCRNVADGGTVLRALSGNSRSPTRSHSSPSSRMNAEGIG